MNLKYNTNNKTTTITTTTTTTTTKTMDTAMAMTMALYCICFRYKARCWSEMAIKDGLMTMHLRALPRSSCARTTNFITTRDVRLGSHNT